MDKKSLMRKSKSELLRMLKKRGLKADPRARKKEAVALLLATKHSVERMAAVASAHWGARTMNKLMAKKKSELLQILESQGIKPNPKALKKELVNQVMESGLGSGTLAGEEAQPAGDVSAKQRRGGTESVRETQQEVGEIKYSTRMPAPEGLTPEAPVGEKPESRPPAEAAHPTELPRRYSEDRIVAMVRDPYWLFVYWEITPQSLRRARGELEGEGADSKLTLRVYDVTGADLTGEHANRLFDVEVAGDADNWYINTGGPERSYRVDIGLLTPRGEYRTIARSNTASTPRAGIAKEVDERWMSLEEHFERIYALSGGFRVGESSAELHEMMQKQLQMQLASEGAAGLSGKKSED